MTFSLTLTPIVEIRAASGPAMGILGEGWIPDFVAWPRTLAREYEYRITFLYVQ
jgi:hypothetical protein